MLQAIFNKLNQNLPYGVALSALANFWSAVVAFVFGAVLVLSNANFSQTGTQDIFLWNLLLSVGVVVLFNFSIHGLWRSVGIEFLEIHDFKVLNNNIKKGQVRKDISNEKLKETFKVMHRLGVREAFIASGAVFFVIGFTLVGEYLASGGVLTNLFPILAGGSLSGFFAIVFTPLHTEVLTTDVRAQIKQVMASREVEYQEDPLWSIRGKMGFVVFLMVVLVISQCLVLYPEVAYEFLVVSLAGLVIVAFLVMLLTSSFYKGVLNITSSISKLTEGKKGIFFSGSLDKELVELSQDLNKAAEEIYQNRRRLKETEKILKVRVKAKTRELKRLNEELEQKVEERTKELKDRIEELERFHRLTVGREKKMIELKRENNELKERLKKHQKNEEE